MAAEERAALRNAQNEEVSVPAGRSVVARGGTAGALHMLNSGWAVMRSETVRGRAAILRVYLPGDVIGLCGLAVRRAPHEVRMQTDGAVRTIDPDGVRRLLQAHPRLAQTLLALASLDQLMMRDQCMALTLMTAEDRLVRFFLDLHARLSMIGGVEDDRIHLPFSQAEIGAAVGMTSVYVNKLMRKLSEEKRIAVERPHLRLLDRPGMEAQTGFTNRLDALNNEWAPLPQVA